jgi:ribonuclease HII
VILLGADENGLGPVLGPMVTTAITLEVARYDRARLLATGQALGVDDSKNTAGFRKMAASEALSLALCEQVFGEVPESVDRFLDLLGFHDTVALRARCPSGSAPQCWQTPLALPCFGGEIAAGRAVIEGLLARGIRVRRAQSAVACAGELNARLAAGVSRVELDLELMELLVLDAREAAGEELTAICGMVGGIRSYPEKMRHLGAKGVRKLPSTKGSLRYAVDSVGEVRFEIDADARHLPVALASMLGKYVRELWMERQNRFYQGHDPSLPAVSGYHDPRTRGLIRDTSALRKRLGVTRDCFERMSVKDLAARDQLPLFAE